MSLFDVLINVVEAYIHLWYITKCLISNNYYHEKYNVYIAIVIGLITTYSNLMVSYSSNITLIIMISFLIYAILFFENSIIEKITIGLSAVLISLISALITINVTATFVGVHHFDLEINSFGYIALLTSTKIVHLLLSVLVIKIKGKVHLSKIEKKWIWLVVALLATIISLIFVFDLLIIYSLNSDFMILILLNIVIFVCIFIGVFTIKKAERDNIVNLMELNQHRHQSEIIKQSKANYIEIKTLRHDLKHVLSSIKGHIEKNEFANAISMINNYNDEVVKITELVYTENYILDYLISNKVSLAREKEITVKLEIAVFEILIEIDDLSLILSNIFDNAIENCSANRIIDFKMMIRDDYIVIKLANSVNEHKLDRNPKLKTTKKNKKEHGYGMISIKKRITRINGELYISEDKNMFIVEIIIPNIN